MRQSRAMSCEVRIGTSGWHYNHWKGNFYPEKCSPAEMFRIYLEHFDTVEINNTFYHLPPHSAFEKWRTITPPRFLFALKGSRFLTHMKKLSDPVEGIARFFEGANLLGAKLGPILFQLPPRWKANPERLDSFIEALPKRRRYAFELRDRSWLVPEIYQVLEGHNAAYCIYDFAGFESPIEITADFTYVRLHGPSENKYQGNYSKPQLRRWADWIGSQRARLRGVYFYFDNDQAGYAAFNAIDLKAMAA
ncbi:MAG: DUF72 domain-containing protein [Thermoanaerobaculia bacterium]